MRNDRVFLRRLMGATSVAVALFSSASALAQSPTVSAADAPQEGGIQEIVVTAQKRAENLQKVPATITALNSEALETRQINNVAGLQSEVPSLVVGEYYGTSLITLRGISTGVTSGAEDPSVATHINGIYQSRSRSVDSAMADLERVEVVSGPQGTLYGRNATGGVINYILKRPGKEFQGEVSARAGNFERFGGQARVSGPVSDRVGVLVSGIFDKQAKGFTRNLRPDAPLSRFETNRTYGGRVAVDADLGVKIELDAIYLDTRTTPVVSAFAPATTPVFQAFLAPQSFRPHETFSELNSRTHTKYFQSSAVMTLNITDDISLKSLTGYQTFRDDMLIDLDASGTASIPVHQRLNSETFTQEFNLNANWLDGRVKSVFGLFYYNDDFLGRSLTDFRLPGFGAVFDSYNKILSKSYAAFTDHTFSVSDRFRLLGGIRFNRDEKTSKQTRRVSGVVNCPLVPVDRDWEAWTPRFGAQFDVADDAMLYGQWSRGFKSGGFASNSCRDEFDPEKITALEAGIKTRLLNNHVRFNLSGYHYKIANLQVQKIVGVGNLQVDNAAAAKIYGAEVSLTALLAENLQLDAAGMVQSAKYQDFENCNETAFVGACSASDPRPLADRFTDVSGNWLNRAAPYSLNVGLQYLWKMQNGGSLLLRGETFFSGKLHFSEFERPDAVQGAYDTQSLFVTYTFPDNGLILRGYVKNIGNRNYKVSYLYQSAVNQGQGNWAPPRTFGVEGTFRF
ncbi:TonB-dependent receptor [Rhizorhabdus argentea]|uniref:TonB-dependent receptor n=1 Tax=Rhizorhabdus argentea TaxID=1387174 RepID=UPI0030ED301A